MSPTPTRATAVLRRVVRSRRALAGLLLTAAAAVAAMIVIPGGAARPEATSLDATAPGAQAPIPALVAPPETKQAGLRVPTTSTSGAGSGQVTIVAVGDITLGSRSSQPPGGASQLLAGVKSALGGGIVLGNLETTLSTGTSSKCGSGSSSCFAFQAPPEYASGLRGAGFNVLNLANNHSYDYGQSGFEQTIRALKSVGIKHTGPPGKIAYRRVGGVRVAIVGFAPNRGLQSVLDIPGARQLVRRADRRSDVVVVTFHGGAEGADATHVRPGMETFLGERRGDLIAFSHAVIDAGADLVVGHGPHVLRAMEWYRGRLIAYSLGNFSSHGNFNTSGPGGVSAILRVTLTSTGGWVAGRVVSVALEGAGAPVIDGSGAGLKQIRSLSKQDFGARGARFAATGAILAKGGADLPPKTVKKVQRQLRKLGYYAGPIDGLYGPGTTAAVREFQKDAGITVDGKYGPQTRQALARALSSAAP